MQWTKLGEVERGQRIIALYRAGESGGLFVSVKDAESGTRQRGLFLSEGDVRAFAHLVADYRTQQRERLRRRESLTEPEREIAFAIENAGRTRRDSVTVLPTMPDYRYRHTCEVCGAHVQAHLRLGPGTSVMVCPFCNHAQDGPR